MYYIINTFDSSSLERKDREMSVHRFPTVPSRRRMPRWLKILGILAFIVWLGMLANDILILKNPKLFMST